MSIEKTINNDAVVYIVRNAKNDEILNELFNIKTVERDVVIFDLSKTESISSKFIGSLINIQKQLNEDNKRFIVSGANQTVKNMLDCIGVSKLFKII